MAAKAQGPRYSHWKPSWSGFFQWIGFVIFPIVGFAQFLKYDKREFERQCRSGEIPYSERVPKFK